MNGSFGRNSCHRYERKVFGMSSAAGPDARSPFPERFRQAS